VEWDATEGVPLRLVDRATGVTRVDLAGWQAELTGDHDQPLVLRRTLAGGKSAFGVVRHDRVQLLGTSAGLVSDCTADRNYVMCRSGEGLELWAYSL